MLHYYKSYNWKNIFKISNKKEKEERAIEYLKRKGYEVEYNDRGWSIYSPRGKLLVDREPSLYYAIKELKARKQLVQAKLAAEDDLHQNYMNYAHTDCEIIYLWWYNVDTGKLKVEEIQQFDEEGNYRDVVHEDVMDENMHSVGMIGRYDPCNNYIVIMPRKVLMNETMEELPTIWKNILESKFGQSSTYYLFTGAGVKEI